MVDDGDILGLLLCFDDTNPMLQATANKKEALKQSKLVTKSIVTTTTRYNHFPILMIHR